MPTDDDAAIVEAASVPHYLSRILRGSETFIVDAQLRTHFISIDGDGNIIEHMRYEGAPDAIIPALVACLAAGDKVDEISGYFTEVNML